MDIDPIKKEKKVLSSSFYQREETLEIGKELLGKYLFTSFEGLLTGGMIVETEAYLGAGDRACHAYGNRRTKRTEAMFQEGGKAYVYLCYGIHHLFNVVTHKKEVPHAILIRSLRPTHGIATMLRRRRKKVVDQTLTNGPATLTEALGIKICHSGICLQGDPIWIEDRSVSICYSQIIKTPRIGIDYAKEDKDLPYRFLIDPRNSEIGHNEEIF